MSRLPDLLEFLESLGFDFTIAGKGVAVEFPPHWADLADRIEPHMVAIRSRLEYLADRNSRCCVGGPIDGRRHHKCPGQTHLHHEARGRWAVYLVLNDWTAKFLGYTGNRRDARIIATCFWTKYTNEAGRE